MAQSGQSGQRFYTFGPFRLDPNERVLFHTDRPIPLTPKARDLLLVLVERHGHIIDKNDLMRIVWPDAFVEENNLTQNISVLRKVLGESADGREYIETIPKRGYRFAKVTEVHEATTSAGREVSAESLAAREADDAGGDRRSDSALTIEAPAADLLPPTEPLSVKEQRVRPSIRTGRLAVLAILIALIVTSLAYFLVLRFSTARVAPSDPFQRMQVVRLTNSGKAMSAIVSPDGKYIALVLDDDGQQGLWLRQVATASSVPIVPAMDVEYWGLTFSPDANYIYYVAWQPNMADAELFRVPTLGGAAEKLVSAGAAIGTPISFAPDGSRLAYLSGRSHETRLVVAKADGTEPRVVALRKDPDGFPMFGTGPAWSPDGSAIACAGAVPGTQGMQNSLVVVRVEDASQEAIGTARWNQVGRIAWLPDSSGLVVTASADRWSPRQIWHVSYPDGSARRVTNDLNQYSDVSITRDARMLVAVQTGSLAGIWVMPTAQPALGKRVASEVERYDGIEGMAWTPDGKLLYRSKVSGNWDLWMVDPDRGDPRRVTFDSTSELHPALPADGEQLVFSSDRTGRMHLWTMPLDRRTGPVQLTDGPDEEVYPQVSSDRRWVVYQEGFSWFRPVSIWKVPISGGKPQRLAPPTSLRPAISPDGRLVAYFRLEHGRWGIHLMPIAGGPAIKSFNIPASSSRILRWTPEGEAVAYVVTSQGVSTIWKQAIAGGPPEPVTDFQPDRVFDFVWSPDGKRLAVVRGVDTSDIVSIAVPWK